MIRHTARHPDTEQEISAFDTEHLREELAGFAAESCVHEKIEIRSIRTKTGGVQIWKLCLDCAQKFQSPLAKKSLDFEPELIDAESVELNYDRMHKRRRFEIIALHAEAELKTNALFAKDWGQYLKSDKWKDKRERVLKRADYICQGCGQERASEVHHVTYERRFFEMLFDLVALCQTCHSLINIEKNERLRGNPFISDGLRCHGCRWQSENNHTKWCSVYDIPAEASLMSENYCDQGRNGYEGLK
jgi:hypothetical protein